MSYAITHHPDAETLAIIASFRRPEYAVAEMLSDGFTHVHSICDDCGASVMMPFKILREQHRVKEGATLAELSHAFTCKQCGGRALKHGILTPSYQYIGTTADTRADSPVNRVKAGRRQ